MAIPQTVYSNDFDIGLEGDWGDSGRDGHVRFGVNETQDMNFGRAVMKGTGDDDVTLPTSTAADFVGITLFTHTGSGSGGASGIPKTMSVSVVRKGRIKVKPETVAAVGDPVYYRYQNSAGGLEGIGRFRNDDDAASGDVVRLDLLFAIKWRTTVTAAGTICILELNIP